jgi:hypothetical protein
MNSEGTNSVCSSAQMLIIAQELLKHVSSTLLVLGDIVRVRGGGKGRMKYKSNRFGPCFQELMVSLESQDQHIINQNRY